MHLPGLVIPWLLAGISKLFMAISRSIKISKKNKEQKGKWHEHHVFESILYGTVRCLLLTLCFSNSGDVQVQTCV